MVSASSPLDSPLIISVSRGLSRNQSIPTDPRIGPKVSVMDGVRVGKREKWAAAHAFGANALVPPLWFFGAGITLIAYESGMIEGDWELWSPVPS